MPQMTVKEDLEGLTLLKKKKTRPRRKLETFPNHHPRRDYVVTLRTQEFTCVVPSHQGSQISAQADYPIYSG